MGDIFEFRVAGSIGPVVQSALPELTGTVARRQTVLHGSTAEVAAIDQLLTLLGEHGLVPNHIVLLNESRWSPTDSAPDADYRVGPGDSAPRQS